MVLISVQAAGSRRASHTTSPMPSADFPEQKPKDKHSSAQAGFTFSWMHFASLCKPLFHEKKLPAVLQTASLKVVKATPSLWLVKSKHSHEWVY